MGPDFPPWVRELDMTIATHPQVLLVGNVRDQYMLPAEGSPDAQTDTYPADLGDVLDLVCTRRGFAALATFDMAADRMEVWPLRPGAAVPESLLAMAADGGADRGDEPPDARMLGRLRVILRDVVGFRDGPIGLVFPYAHRLGSPRNELSGEGKLMMAGAEIMGHQAIEVDGPSRVMPYNTVFWVAERQEQMPVEFMVATTKLRVITIPQAPAEQRLAAARHATRVVFSAEGTPDPDPADLTSAARTLYSVSHGMTNSELLSVAKVAIDQEIPVAKLDEAARLYRVGVKDNPWATSVIRERILNGESLLAGRSTDGEQMGVIGQDRAVRKAVDIFMRSAAGMSGAQSSSSPNRPRGVLFLAGPTGVGKTELAKGVARMIFGRDAEPIRFDMSEFGQEHARERLIGAPPGFVGFDAGGELTNAVRASPMCVLLFDEIEKAHPRLFDIFLQILEDGRLTDGRGSTVHFTECVLIFTSNLGASTSPTGGRNLVRLTHRSDPDDVRRVLRQAFVDFFDTRLGRPELRNRLGDSFIAMDFITADSVPALLDRALASIARRATAVHEITVTVAPSARETLHERAVDALDLGGRGVNNAVETLLINPLSRRLVIEPPMRGETWTVTKIIDSGDDPTIEVIRC